MMTEVVQDDLAWDYTADECSPLLRRAVSPHSRRNQRCALTLTQAQYLLHSLSEATQILRTELHHGTPDDYGAVDTSLAGAPPTSSSLLATVHGFYRKTVRYTPVVMISIQVLMVLIETIIDAASGNHKDSPHKPYVSAVFVSISFVFLVMFYVDLVSRFLNRVDVFLALFGSFIASCVLFANVYAIFFRFDDSGWLLPLKPSSDEVFIVTFLRMIHLSISVFTLSQDVSGIQTLAWYPLALLSIQMLLAYCHLVMIFATITGLLRPRLPVTIPNRVAEGPSFQREREPDVESISFGTHLPSGVNSRPVAAPPRNVANVNSDDERAALLLSNSI